MIDDDAEHDVAEIDSGSFEMGRNQRLGLLLIVGGFVLLIGLRFVTSPIGREVTGYSAIGLREFLLIPVFLVLVGLGIVVFVWGEELW